MAQKGRRNVPKSGFKDTVPAGSAEQGMLLKQDEIIDILKALMAKLDADTGVQQTDFAASLTDALKKVVLK